ncbi:conjugative transfer signal peptidase TraF [Oricola indica]|uniref:conjugative transfer signal peptidase TraF n=1 Tax=Oricola indica TaxID=2872591 RepID=UPI001CC0FF22
MIRRRRIAIVAALVAVPVALFAVGYGARLRVNLSPSYPLGFWRIHVLHRDVRVGDLVFICPPQTATFDLAFERGYIRPGLCPGWRSPLIKTVVALPGQTIGIGSSVTIDGRPLPSSGLQPVDGVGRALTPFTGGVVPAGKLLLHSDYEGSYDSRYFGPIPASGVLGLAEPVLTLEP